MLIVKLVFPDQYQAGLMFTQNVTSIEPFRQNLEIVSLFLYYFVFYLTGITAITSLLLSH